MTRVLAAVLAAAMAMPGCAARTASRMGMAAQAPLDDAAAVAAWRTFVEKLPAGTRLTLTHKNGRRVHATLLEATGEGIVVSPRTRIPEPVQTVRFVDLAALDLDEEGTSSARAVGVGLATGLGAFFALLLLAAGIG